LYIEPINYKSIKMKNILTTILLFCFTATLHSQAVVMDAVTLNEGIEKDYIKFEKMWSNVHEKIQKNGEKAGWYLFKVIPTKEGTQWPPKSSKPWCDYVILNFYSDDNQLDGDWGMGSNQKARESFIRNANYKKMKSSEVSRLIKMGGKFKKKVASYTLKGIDATVDVGPFNIGDRATYLGIEQLNEDYENYETKWYKEGHNTDIINGRRLAWYFNKIIDRSENSYKPISHVIFERFNPNPPGTNSNNQEPTFIQQMMWKHGGESRKIHGGLILELVDFKD